MSAALAATSLALGVVVPAAIAQTHPLPSDPLERDASGQVTERAPGARRFGGLTSRARLRLPAPPVSRRELAARGGSPAAFDRRCIRAGGVAPRSNTARYAPSSRLLSRAPSRSRCDPEFHDGLPATQEPAETSVAPLASSISGYMDFHFNNIEHQDATIDFHRFVLLFTHSFSDRLRFVSELELEHAFVEGLEEAGELELEQAYLDFLVTRELNFRAGMLLVPVGIINERHEPPVYHGVERPFVDTVIVPSTWFEAGAGVHGELGRGLRYRAYVMAPLDAAGFSADEGVRGGRQKGAEANVRNVATTGRVEYVGMPGLWAGASLWRGKTGFSFPRVETQVTLAEVDARYRVGELETRAQYAHVWLDGMGELNRTLQRTIGVSPNVARQIRGFYLEASYFVLPNPAPREAAVFVRYENFDTQYRMPIGLQAIPEFDRDAWVVGVSYYLDPDVVLKLDYSIVRNQSEVVDAPNSFNIGLGWWF